MCLKGEEGARVWVRVCVCAVRAGGSFFLSKSDPQIILGAQIGVKGTRRSLEIAFYPLAFFFYGSATFNRHHLIALNGKAIREKWGNIVEPIG